jgi:hypothetical protein
VRNLRNLPETKTLITQLTVTQDQVEEEVEHQIRHPVQTQLF